MNRPCRSRSIRFSVTVNKVREFQYRGIIICNGTSNIHWQLELGESEGPSPPVKAESIRFTQNGQSMTLTPEETLFLLFLALDAIEQFFKDRSKNQFHVYVNGSAKIQELAKTTL